MRIVNTGALTDDPADEIQTRAQQRREQILDAAAACFRHKGFHAASIAGISQVAGMSPGHIYHYFENKEAIVAAIVAREESEFEALIDATRAALPDLGLVEAILAQVENAVARHTDLNRARLMLEIQAEASRNPTVAEMVQRSSTVLRAKFISLLGGLAVDAAVPDPPDADLVARIELIGALFEGLTIRRIRDPQLDLETLSHHLRRIVRQILDD